LLEHWTCDSRGRRFDSQPFCFHVTTWASLFTHVCLCHQTHTHTHPFNGPFSGTTLVSRYQKGKTNLDYTEARDSEWYWHQLGHMQVCTSLQTDNHASTPPLIFLQAGCPSCHPTDSAKALKCQERGFYCPDSASSLNYKGSASLNGAINLRVCA